MTHKPRGRKSNFFDGGVFGAILYQGIFQTMLVLGVYGWALLSPEHATRAEIHADALTMAFATLGLINCSMPLTLNRFTNPSLKWDSSRTRPLTGQFQLPLFS